MYTTLQLPLHCTEAIETIETPSVRERIYRRNALDRNDLALQKQEGLGYTLGESRAYQG